MFQLPPVEVSPEEAREAADQVLSGRGYLDAARPPTLQERIFDWLGDLISDVFRSLTSGGGRGLFGWVIIVLFVALIVFLVVRLLRDRGPLPVRSIPAGPVIDVVANSSPEEWLMAAKEAEAVADWRTAVRCRHQALTTTLIRRGVVAAKPGQTAGEIERIAVQQLPHIAEPMQEATWLFKDTWYGWTDATVDSSVRFEALSEQILASDRVPA